MSLELLTKARDLAAVLSCDVEALLIGYNVRGLADELYAYGAKTVHLAEDPRLEYFRTLPYAAIIIDLFRREKPQIALFGATSVGRDLAPRVSSALHSGLTADCTALEIGDHQDKEKQYHNLLYQIRPAFGGNIIATIVNPEHRPQMATVREGVMKKAPLASPVAGRISEIDVASIVKDSDLTVEIVAREIEERKIDIKGAQIIVAGGFGVGSKSNWPGLLAERWEHPVPLWTQALRTMPARSARPELQYVPNCSSHAVYPDRYSIPPVWTSHL